MTMSEHKHRQPVEGCHRCNLNRDEMAQQQQDELLASLVGGPPSPWQTLHDIAEDLYRAGLYTRAYLDTEDSSPYAALVIERLKRAGDLLAGAPDRKDEDSA